MVGFKFNFVQNKIICLLCPYKGQKKSVPLHPPLKKKKTTKRYLGVVAVDMALIDQTLIDKGRGL